MRSRGASAATSSATGLARSVRPTPAQARSRARAPRARSRPVARATIAGLKGLRRPDEIAAMRGIPAEDFVPKALLEAYQRAEAGIGKPDPSASDSLENDNE